ncbi:hypothetical protein FRB97_003824, partial [Tulasnella sp. 331]
ASVSHDLVFEIVQHAFKTNPDAAIECGLAGSVHDLIRTLKASGGPLVQSGMVEHWAAGFQAVMLEARMRREAVYRSPNGLSRARELNPMDVI